MTSLGSSPKYPRSPQTLRGPIRLRLNLGSTVFSRRTKSRTKSCNWYGYAVHCIALHCDRSVRCIAYRQTFEETIIMAHLPPTGDQVRIVEVGPRDGLQNISYPIPTDTKVSLIQRLHSAGLHNIEITSIVSPKAVPQLADNQQVLSNGLIKNLLSRDDLRLPILVPNRKGVDLAIKFGVKEVAVFVSASEGFSRANTKCSVEEGLSRAREVAGVALGARMQVRGWVQHPRRGNTSKNMLILLLDISLAFSMIHMTVRLHQK